MILETPELETMIEINLNTVRELQGKMPIIKESDAEEVSPDTASTYENLKPLAKETKPRTSSTTKKQPAKKR